MVFEPLPDGSVYIIERKGAFKKYDPTSQSVKQIGVLPTYKESDQGLVGFTFDPKYATNHWVYFFYGHRTEPNMLLTRWELRQDKLIESSQKVLLEIPVDREDVSHMGGGMTWDSQGNLYLTTGNNTANVYVSQTDERPGRSRWDDQRSSANTNDLRGKILRIHPTTDAAEPTGKYTIPAGNLFPEGTRRTRPEIYTMGNRNPWRPSIDSKTGWLYWGEIGPDADVDSENGPRGYDELNQARKPGFFGWPYFIGENQAYPLMDFEARKPGQKKDPNKPTNLSPNNSGLNELPPAQSAFIAYPYAVSAKYPLVGSSSRCAVGGPIYHRSDFKNPKRPFPAYYEGKWLAADLSRFWIMAIEMDEKGDYKSMERFAPDYHPRQPIDLKFGADGDLYVLEYGGSTQRSPVEARLVRIEYNAGNRKPVVQATASKKGGSLPLTVALSSAGSQDFDGDALTYQWTITAPGIAPKTVNSANPELTLTKAGVYQATLTVTDAKGAKNSQSLRLVAGNEPPVVSLNLSTNRDFFFAGKPIQYTVDVQDKEDGSLADGRIKPTQIAISVDYVSEGFDLGDIGIGYQRIDASTQYAVARALMSKSDCNNCHNPTIKGVGPSYGQIAARYQTDSKASDRLVQKVIKGGTGVWSNDIAMPAHPTLSVADAQTMVNYILNITNKSLSTLPINGNYIATILPGDKGKGKFILRAAYSDRGTNSPGINMPVQTSEHIVVLRSPQLLPTEAQVIAGGAVRDQLDEYTFLTAKPNSYIGYKSLDLTDIKQVEFRPNWHLYDIYRGGYVEIRLDSPTGELLGKTEIKEEQFNIKKMPGGMDKFWSRPPADDKTARTFTSTATLKSAVGKHDLYFVFKSDDPTTQQALFPLALITFKDD